MMLPVIEALKPEVFELSLSPQHETFSAEQAFLPSRAPS
jgi:hypothetical protein